jgi:tetratricopeptide (TPR) repeat protein
MAAKTENSVSKKSPERKYFIAFILVTLIVAVGYTQYLYDSRNDYFAEHQTFITLPKGNTLKILSFGFHNLVADILYIWSIQFYSDYNLTNSYDYLEHIYNTITDMCPRYLEPYIVGSWIMALEAQDVKMAIRLLQKGAKNMPENWIFDYECGFYAYNTLKDFKLAEKYFNKALENPKAPPHVRRIKAHMVYMSDDLDYAYRLWFDIYQNAKSMMAKNSARKHLHQIKMERDKKSLEKQIKRFREKYNRLPTSLDELKLAGLVKQIPLDFEGNPYIYNTQTGKVTAEQVFRWKKWL